MWRIRTFFMKLKNFLWRSRAERELKREVDAHLTLIQDELERKGLPAEEARLAAKRAFGGIDQAKELHRDERSFFRLDQLRQDLLFTARMLRKRPGFTCIAVLMLGLGIGVNTAMFTILNSMLFRPLPFTDSDRLVALVDEYRRVNESDVPPTVPEFLDVRAGSKTLENLAFFDTRDVQITGGDEPYRALAARVTASAFPLLGTTPVLGRVFHDNENLPGNERVMVLSNEIWRHNFAGDPSVIGRQVGLNRVPYTIVGVLPAGFSFNSISLGTGDPVEVYIPFLMNDYYTLRSGEFSNVRRVQTIAKLKPEYGLTETRAELKTIAARLVQAYPTIYRDGGEDTGFAMDVKPLRDALVGSRERAFLVLLSVSVALVLLIACVNMAQFLLARSIERESEIAVRVALGAGRWRLVRQFLTESLLLAAAGGALGLLQTTWLVRVVAALLPGVGGRTTTFVIDGNVLGFVVLISILATLIFGVLPALQLSRANPAGWLVTREPASGSNRARHTLVAVEVAMSMILLVSAGFVIQGLIEMQNAPRGFSMDNVTVMQVRMIQQGNPIQSVNYQRYLAQLSAIAGVESATVVTQLPMRGGAGTPFLLEGRPNDLSTRAQHQADYRIVSPDYFKTFQIPLLEGRAFSDNDIVGQPRVAIVNEEMVRRSWPGENPLGKRFGLGGGAAFTVVGVVGNVRVTGAQLGAEPQIYVSYLQNFEPNMFIAVRTAPGYVPPPDAIKKAIWSVAPDQAVFKIRPMNEVVSESVAFPRFTSSLLGTFSLIALIMSAIGVYTVISYLIARRTREIAIRIATGAQRPDVLRLVAAQTFGWAATGLLLGLGGALAASGLLRATLPGVAQTSLATLVAVAFFHILIVAVAMGLPCLRALRLDAAAALRSE